MRPSTKRNTLFTLCIAIASLLLCLASWNTAGAQVPTPTPADDVWCITPEPSGDEVCMSAPIAVTVTPTATVMPPPTPTATATPIALSPLPVCALGRCGVFMPIGVKP